LGALASCHNRRQYQPTGGYGYSHERKLSVTAGMIVGLILLPFAWMLIAAANQKHREETGVNGPTHDGWRRIRRNAGKKGISEAEAYNQWLNRKGRRTPSAIGLEFIGRDDRPHRTNTAPKRDDPPSSPDADEPLRALASARKWSLHRQLDGQYYILNLGRSPSAFVRNPAKPDSHEFTREQVVRFLSG
jgi:hypothetical protein